MFALGTTSFNDESMSISMFTGRSELFKVVALPRIFPYLCR